MQYVQTAILYLSGLELWAYLNLGLTDRAEVASLWLEATSEGRGSDEELRALLWWDPQLREELRRRERKRKELQGAWR